MLNPAMYTPEHLISKAREIFALARNSENVDDLRQALSRHAHRVAFATFNDYDSFSEGSIIRVRDCADVLNRILARRSEDRAGFSVAEAIRDIARDKPRPDLTPAFYAELLYLFLGLQGRGPGRKLVDLHLVPTRLKGRKAAIERSRQLDELSIEVEAQKARFQSGLADKAVLRREKRRARILKTLKADKTDWHNWQWQADNVLRDPELINQLLKLSDSERQAIESARAQKLPFGITPHYLSLMDDALKAGRDRAIRAQVIPPPSYVEQMGLPGRKGKCLDFMREADTSPADLITRRYPAICIFKPFNTCPQICVYCQRNWEINDAMEPGAMASDEAIKKALRWIKKHPAIHEVLLTGGDPLAMPDKDIRRIMDGLAAIPSVERIRIGSRTLVTMPMRITDSLADLLAAYLVPGKRQVAVVTHIQHPYEITPDTVTAVQRLKRRGISVYNQLVYTFFVSRRFEAAFLRRKLALIGVEPYYTFNTKGKEETVEYRVPIARLLQEQKEEARLLPGMARTDEAVYNVPGLGKSYLRASQHRDLISILPDGARLYEFHPWEKNISKITSTHTSEDVPILDYLKRLHAIGENPRDYKTIWYYY
ncbi:MAG: KamA family radical SAM protein [Desulfobacterales bacterium]|nr:KamA family radical SAM protein [Desulfobacterales bacterium]